MVSDFEARMSFILDTVGADKVNRDFDRVTAKMMTLAQFAKKYNIQGGGMKGGVEAKMSRFREMALEADILEKRYKNNKYFQEKVVDFEIDAVKRTNKEKALAESKAMKERLANQKKLQSAQRKLDTRFRAEWLSGIFMGMQLQKAMFGLFSGMLTVYKEFTKDGVTPLSKSLIGLQANWKFLQFSMATAATPLLTYFADAFANLARWLSKADPKVLEKIVLAIGILGTFGFLATQVSQIVILAGSLSALSAIKEDIAVLKGLKTGVGGLSKSKMDSATSFLGALSTTAGIATIGFAISDGLQGIEDIASKDWGGALLNAASTAMGFVAGAKLLKGGSGAGVWATAYIAVKLIEEGLIGKSLMSIIGTVSGIMNGLVNIGFVANAKITEGLNGTILGYFLGVSDDVIRKQVASVSFGEAFSEGFSDGFIRNFKAGENFDEFILSLKKSSENGDDLKWGSTLGKNLLPSKDVETIKQAVSMLTMSQDVIDEYNNDLTSIGLLLDTGKISEANTLLGSIQDRTNTFNTKVSDTATTIAVNLTDSMEGFRNGTLFNVSEDVKKLNENLGKTITKTVKIKYDYGNRSDNVIFTGVNQSVKVG